LLAAGAVALGVDLVVAICACVACSSLGLALGAALALALCMPCVSTTEQVWWCASTTETHKVVYILGGVLLDSVLVWRD
jgi:hypothetical protein